MTIRFEVIPDPRAPKRRPTDPYDQLVEFAHDHGSLSEWLGLDEAQMHQAFHHPDFQLIMNYAKEHHCGWIEAEYKIMQPEPVDVDAHTNDEQFVTEFPGTSFAQLSVLLKKMRA